KGVEILDPFTGTGTFITRMIQSDLIDIEALPHKYRHEIHANEIMLLAYYIAAVNIETAYHKKVKSDEYQQFSGIILTDTFSLNETDDMIAGLMPENSERIEHQKDLGIQVIIGNPPWRVGQKSENDAAQNQSYPALNQRIANSYAKYSTASNKNSLYNSYIQAICWASERIGNSGVIGFVTPSNWLDGVSMDGMRKCLADDFSAIYILDLGGDSVVDGSANAFDGIKTGNAISILVKNPESTISKILYHLIGHYTNRKDKVNHITTLHSIRGLADQWVEVQPDGHHDWLSQRDAGFDEFMAIGDKKSQSNVVIFKNYSSGVKTNRDPWIYNYSEVILRSNLRGMVDFYNRELQRFSEEVTHGRRLTTQDIMDFVDNDSTKISWTRALRNDLAKNKGLRMDEGRVMIAQYRPFTRTHIYFSRRLNEMVYQMPKIFPYQGAENLVICVTGLGNTKEFSCVLSKYIPDVNSFAAGAQCFPRWLYNKPSRKVETSMFDLEETETDTDPYGYVRESAINDMAFHSFQEKMGGGRPITHDDLFYFIYGILHCPSYREKYATNLRKQHPRIPFPENAERFWMIAGAGRRLGHLHANYEEIGEWGLVFENGGWDPSEEISHKKWFRVEKMKHPGKARNKDLSRIIYNDYIILKDIPVEAYDYVVNGKSAIAWVMERQSQNTNSLSPGGRSSQIVNDANRFAVETMKDPAYPLRLLAKVITVSMETIKIVNGLVDIDFSDNPTSHS
ncbi:MAG: damage-inducible protein, partial [Bacteroidetes bacterium]|nr:damage-inducible protein [Bacteroidota bacterium]